MGLVAISFLHFAYFLVQIIVVIEVQKDTQVSYLNRLVWIKVNMHG